MPKTAIIAHPGQQVLLDVDLRTLGLLGERATSPGPFRLAADPKRDALWIVNHFGDRITRLSWTSLDARTALPSASQPSALALDPVRGRMFAANLQTGTVVRWDGVEDSGADTSPPRMTTLLSPSP